MGDPIFSRHYEWLLSGLDYSKSTRYLVDYDGDMWAQVEKLVSTADVVGEKLKYTHQGFLTNVRMLRMGGLAAIDLAQTICNAVRVPSNINAQRLVLGFSFLFCVRPRARRRLRLPTAYGYSVGIRFRVCAYCV